jgi:sialic acid synthase SpsE
MGSKNEILKAVKTAIETGNKKILLLHCVSIYPANYKNLNLKTILWLKKNFKHLIGYSDHSTSIEIPSFASILGACLIEKHFTLDTNKKGFDNKISLNQKKFKQMSELIRSSFLTLGKEEKKLTLSEQKNKIKYRRYIVANENIKKGSVLRKSNISIKRVLNGINGLEPGMIGKLYGRKSLKNIKKNTLIKGKFINLR